MKAVLCKQFGPPEGLVVEDIAPLEPGPGQAVITVHAAAVNFPDLLMLEDKFLSQYKAPLPFSPGSEAAGVVKAVGAGVQHLAPGDRVIAVAGPGAFADEMCVDASRLLPLPEGVAMPTAASLVVTYGTTLYALKERAQLQHGETLLVLGAAGGAGSSAVEIGRLLGARVIAAASSPEKLSLARELGAHDVVDYQRENLRERIRELTDGHGVDVIFDPVGGTYAEPALRSMAWGGRFLVIGFTAGEIPRLPLNLVLLKGCSIVGVYYNWFSTREPRRWQQGVAQLLEWVRAGRIRPRIGASYPLEEAAIALRLVADRAALGKVVVTTERGRSAMADEGVAP